MPLKVSDGMGAWISDFKKSDAPQFQGKSDKERREMAIAAYMDAKKESVDEAKRTVTIDTPDSLSSMRVSKDKPPFTPDPPKPKQKNSDGTTSSPMSRARQLAKMARDKGMKKEDVNEAVHPDHVTLHPHKTDKTKYTVGQVGKNVKGRLNPGEHVSDSEVDDLHDMGMKVKHERRPYRESVDWEQVIAYHESAIVELESLSENLMWPNMPSSKSKFKPRSGKLGAKMKDVTKDLAHRAKRHEFQGGQQKQNLDRDYKNWHGPTGSGKRWDLASPGKRKAAADRTQAIVTAHKKAKKAANHALQTIQKHGPHHAASKAAVAKYNAANDHVANLPEHYSMTESTQNPSHWHALAKNHADQANHHSDQAKKHDTSYISGDATIVHPMRARAEASHKGARDTHQDAGAAAKKVAHAIEKHGNDHPTTKRLKGQYGDEHHLAKKQSQEAREASAKLGAHNQRRDANRYNESVEIDEAHAYSKAAKALQDYGSKSGGIDKKDFHIAAKHLDNIGKAGLMQKGDHLAKFNRHLKDLDTDVRDRIHMTLKQHGVMESVQEAKVKLKGFGPDHAKGNMGNPAARAALGKRMADNEKARQALKDPSHNPAWANSKSKTEETVSELKKSTLGSYVNKASRDAASKAYGAASAAKDNRADQAGKDFSKSMKRLKGVETATRKMAKEDIDEAKSFDQKFKDHLKFATSKSKAVQDYMAKRKAKRDDAHAKQDPAAVKKNYGPAVIPPGTAYNKARKKGMNPSAAADAVSTAFKNRAKGRKLPEGKIEEAAQFKVDIEGLPPTFIQGKSSAEILANLRKIVKQPSLIKNVERYTDMEVKKAYRQKAQGRPMGEAIDSTDTGGAEETKMAMKQIKAMRHFLDGIEQRVGNQGDMEEWYQNKLTKANDYLKSLYAYGKGDEEV